MINVVALVCLLPLAVHRIQRWRQHRSPVTAITAVAVAVLWMWLLLGWLWELLPPLVQAMEMTGAPGVVLVSVMQLFVVSQRQRVRAPHVWVVAAAGAGVLAVMAMALVATKATSLDLHAYRFDVAAHPDNTGLAVAVVTANVYIAVILAQVIWLCLRNADNTATGWGLGFLAAGSAASLVPVIHDGICLRSAVPGDAGYTWLKAVPAALAWTFILAGFATPPLAVYMDATRRLRQLKPLRQYLIEALPALDAPLMPGTARADRVHEWCSQIQDGLTLTAQQCRLPLYGAQPPVASSARAGAVARWLAGGDEPALNCTWLTTPTAMRDEDWVLAIAAAYRRHKRDHGLSESPSTLRK